MRTLACTAAAAALLLAAPVALAHEGNPNYRSVVSTVTPDVPGDRRLGAQLRRPPAAAQHQRQGRRDPRLPDRRSRTRGCWPTGPSRSTRTPRPTTSTRTGSARPRCRRTCRREPEWKQVSRSSRFEWHDHRAHWMGKGDPPGLKDKDVRTKIDDWDVPIEVDGQTGLDRGHADLGSARGRPAAARRDHRLRRARDRARDRRVRRAPPPRGDRREPRRRRSSRRGEARARARAGRAAGARAGGGARLTRRCRRRCPSAARSSTARRPRSCSSSTRRSRRASARCACSTPTARRCRSARPSTRAARAREIAIKLKPGLGDGTYTATFRVVSADGHPVSSGFVFTVGEAAAAVRVARRVAGRRRQPARSPTRALSVARGFQYGAIALGLGALIFLLVVLAAAAASRSRAFTARLERILLVAALAGLRLGGRRDRAAGRGRLRAARSGPRSKPDTVREVLNTRFGTRLGHRRARVGARAGRAGDAAAARPRGRSPRRRGGDREPVLVARRRRPRLPAAAPAAAPAPAAPRALRRRALVALAVPLVRARAAALARRPHERAAAGRGAAAGQHRARAGDERLARRDRRARARAARRHRRAGAGRSGRRCWPAPSGASPRSPRSRCRWCCSPASCSRSSRSAASPRCSTPRSGAPC